MSGLSINPNLESNDTAAYNYLRSPIHHSVRDLEKVLSIYRALLKTNDFSSQDDFGIHEENDW